MDRRSGIFCFCISKSLVTKRSALAWTTGLMGGIGRLEACGGPHEAGPFGGVGGEGSVQSFSPRMRMRIVARAAVS